MNRDQALEQVDTNTPEVKAGQTWKLRPEVSADWQPGNDVTIVCRYPFGEPRNGRMWITESNLSLVNLQRIPELTLRYCYELIKDVK